MPITLKTNAIEFKGDDSYISTALLEHTTIINPKGYVTPEVYGAVGNGIADDTQAWKDAIASNQIILATKTYLCSEPLELNNDVYCVGKIVNNTTDGIKIDSKGNHTYVINVECSSVIDNATRIGVEVKNCNNCIFRIRTSNFYEGLKIHGDGTGCCYNSIETLFTRNAMYSVHITSENSGWANENYFYNHRAFCSPTPSYSGSCVGAYLNNEGGRSPNSNHFINCCYEGAYCGVQINNGSYNTFENIRMEGTTYNAIFGTGTQRNLVYPSYNGGTTTDNGTNAVITIPKIISVFSSQSGT